MNEVEGSMKTLNDELRHDIAQAGGEPLRLLDPESGQEYVVLHADVYDRLKLVLQYQDANFDPRDAYASILKAWDKDDELPEQYVEYLQGE
jgi:hypothetical protein